MFEFQLRYYQVIRASYLKFNISPKTKKKKQGQSNVIASKQTKTKQLHESQHFKLQLLFCPVLLTLAYHIKHSSQF